ncbi:MAG TPA: M23 family metallopeptidase, partial [Candidatus Ignatzschineria merdigallinarum]|nr:M23 family metallopeptidase [Candidatus Ignatzschineria merdigallinarum]
NPNIPGQKGIQIAGTINQPIKAAHDGEVVFAGAGNSGYGQLIIVRHNANTYTAYGYLSSINVKEGTKVKKGQAIAGMGNSFDGRTVLYFEIRTKGQTVNPMNYI